MQNQHWLQFEPDYARFESPLSQLAYSSSFREELQPRLSDAISRFVRFTHQPRILRITSQENMLYRDELIAMIKAKDVCNIIAPSTFNAQSMLGYCYQDAQGDTHKKPGFLHDADNGILLIPATQLLANASLWPEIKAVVAGEKLAWRAIDNKKQLPLPEPASLNIKLVVYGDRTSMADIEAGEPDVFSGLWIYGEYEQDVELHEGMLNAYTSMVTDWCERLNLPKMADDAWPALFRAGAREAEEHDKLPLCPLWHVGVLTEAALEANGDAITKDAIQLSRAAIEFRESYLPNRALEDIHGGHVIIDCKGKEVGQVNGLTVVEMSGHPKSYGEPSRISCVVHFGDGDIADVERKADMAGNIHAKGMMIMQAFVSAALDLNQPLPYSASIVFEQSYCEVDGDSASLAELCAFVSALSKVEINQQIAVTGAVDQFGRVQAVGGINEKIEGFFHVCSHRGLTGEQGVILPQANIVNLCLNDEVMNAIKEGQFHLWPVEDVHQALPLLTEVPFDGERDQETLLNKIGQRIDEFHGDDLPPRGLISRILNWFVQN
ncbi:S16 family serine protease [Thaumasiovibrio subtropicus]|uniref:S16 family serine protease n=1 Tax=Thaumasiovibrio subtropicus TaxID=1891207 RepID=UPI000B359153|nr:Lon protease family protein [Thaumasiovibrio subtropicus]